eukprot:jgi/Astpho2/2707/Aster-00893
MKLAVLLLALLVGAFVLPCGAQSDDTSVDSVAVAPAPTPGGAILPSVITTGPPGTLAASTTTNSSSGKATPSVTTAPSTVTTKAPAPAGTRVPQVVSTVTLAAYTIDTFTTAVQQTFINAIRNSLPPTSNVKVAITRITAGSVNVESSVTFLDGDTTAASNFATTLSNPSAASAIFSSSGLGAATLSGTVSTQSVVGRQVYEENIAGLVRGSASNLATIQACQAAICSSVMQGLDQAGPPALGRQHSLAGCRRQARLSKLCPRGRQAAATSRLPSSPYIETPPAPPMPRDPGRGHHGWGMFTLGVFLAMALQFLFSWLSVSPFWENIFSRREPPPAKEEPKDSCEESTALVLYSDYAESVEWVNMCWRKAWRIYQRGLERWLADLLQPVFDSLITDQTVPRFVQRLRILEFTLDHEAPYFNNMRRRSSRKDSDLNGVVDVRYTGGARMLLLLEIGSGKWRLKIPVLVSDLDLECKLWLKIRLAPMCPYFGTISLAFVGSPTIKVQLLPYNRVRLMRIPVLQAFLTKLLTVDLPSLMVLPKRLEINIPPAITSVAEAAVGHDADALEHALIAALPLGPQSAAGGVSLPDSFSGELQVNLKEARNLPVWGFPWQSNPYCRLRLGSQVVRSRRDDDTSHEGSHKAPVWNQEFQFLVEDVLEIAIKDSRITGRSSVGVVRVPLRSLPEGGRLNAWLPVVGNHARGGAEGELNLEVTYKPFEDDEQDSGYREAEAFALLRQQQNITDVKSAADASSRAAVAASAAAAAVAVTKAAAARAVAKAASAASRQRPSGADLSGNGASQNGSRPSAAQRSASMADRWRSEGPSDRLTGNGTGTPSTSSELTPSGPKQTPVGPSADREQAQLNFLRISSLQREQLGRAAQPEGAEVNLDTITPEQLFPGVEFRVTEEFDEDLPFAAKGAVQGPPVESGMAEAVGQATKEASDPLRAASSPGKGVGSTRNAAEAPRGSVGRGQVTTLQDSPASVDAGIELGRSMDGEDALAASAAMNSVTGKVGVTRKLDGRGHEAPRRPQGPQEGGSELRGQQSWLDPQLQQQADELERQKAFEQHLQASAPPQQQQAPRPQRGELGWSPDSAQSSVGAESLGRAQDQQGPRDQGSDEVNDQAVVEDRQQQGEVVEAIVVPPDLPLEAIAEEVKHSWRLKEVQVEQLLERAVAKSERPWLILLSALTAGSILLLVLVFYKLHLMAH